MRKIWRTFRDYFWWTYPRGSLQYDVMVTLILGFIFLSPRWINFKDKAAELVLYQKDVVVSSDGQGGFIYQVDASGIASPRDFSTASEDALYEALYQMIEPIAGEVRIVRHEPVRDAKGRITSYKVWVTR